MKPEQPTSPLGGAADAAGGAEPVAGRASVIVTTRNSGRTLDACLRSIRAQQGADVELIVVDNASSDDTVAIARRHSDIVTDKGPERSAQRNLGAELASGEVLAFIDSDMVLGPRVVAQGVEALADPATTGVIVPEVSFGDGFWTDCRVLERSCYDGDDTQEAARFYRRTDFLGAGGFDTSLLGPEDWDLSRRLAGPHPARTSDVIRHDEGTTSLRDVYRKRKYYAPGYLAYRVKHGGALRGQGNPILRPAYLRNWRALAADPVRAGGMFVLKAVEAGAVVQVALEQRATGRSRAGRGELYDTGGRRRATAGVSGGAEEPPAARHRPLMVTFGSVQLPLGGLQTRSRLTAELFAEMGSPISIVSHREPPGSPTPPWAHRLAAPARRARRGFSIAFARLLRAEAGGRTCLFVTNAMFMPVVALSRVRLPIVWDTNECQTLHYRRLPPSAANRAKWAAWLLLERWAGRRCDVAVAIGEAEAVAWRSTHPRLARKLKVVDHATLAVGRDPVRARKALEARLGRPLEGPVLLFLGTMVAKHNLRAAQWIVDDLAPALDPGVTVVLCGPGSERFARPPGADPTTGRGGEVVGLGAVDDVDEVVAAADVCLAPLAAGAGVKTKVLHYLAHGKPVIGTPLAFEGVADAPGLVVADLADFAGVVGDHLAHLHSAAPNGAQARAQQSWLDEHHGRAHVAEQWRSVLKCLPSS